ncbi:MAG: aryl-sulfate sulfotransferase, partial [bacterium]
SWDHYEITEARNVDLTAPVVDYVHSNALEGDADGSWLLSDRHMDQITKIDRTTGEVLWRLGGTRNAFVFVGDIDDSTGFSRQHDIRRLENGHVTLYDNGNFHSPRFSRAVEYELDEYAYTATLVWQYRNAPDTFGGFMGSVQRLPNGNTLIGWGGTRPTATEVRPDGTKAHELDLGGSFFSYRALRFPWDGRAARPAVWVTGFDRRSRTLTLAFDRFGDPDVDHYDIYAGADGSPESFVVSTVGHSAELPDLASGRHAVRVRAVDAAGVESPFSDEVSFTYTNAAPWPFWLLEPADSAVVDSDRIAFRWTRSIDTNLDSVAYTLRLMEGEHEIVVAGLTDTSCVYDGDLPGAGHDPVGTGRTFRWTVTAADQEFETASRDTFALASARAELGRPDAFTLRASYPNPFRTRTMIHYDLRQGGRVRLTVHDVSGRRVATLVDAHRDPGYWSVDWDGRDGRGIRAAAGVYFYRLEAPEGVRTRKSAFMP